MKYFLLLFPDGISHCSNSGLVNSCRYLGRLIRVMFVDSCRNFARIYTAGRLQGGCQPVSLRVWMVFKTRAGTICALCDN